MSWSRQSFRFHNRVSDVPKWPPNLSLLPACHPQLREPTDWGHASVAPCGHYDNTSADKARQRPPVIEPHQKVRPEQPAVQPMSESFVNRLSSLLTRRLLLGLRTSS